MAVLLWELMKFARESCAEAIEMSHATSGGRKQKNVQQSRCAVVAG
jgi:hypothetical protein